MAVVTIITKNNDAAGVVPSPGNLVEGELAVNTTDRKLYTLDNGGNVVLLSSGTDYDDPVTIDVSSASAALRITQRGAGNALLVEDSTNPDSTPYVITATGDVGIGTDTPTYKLDVRGDISFGANQVGESGEDGGNPFIGSVGALPLIVTTDSGTERFRFSNTGALAIAGASNYGTQGQLLTSNGNAAPTWEDQFLSITFIFSAGGSTIATGIAGDLTIPFACEITEWTLLADQTGSIVVDIWKDTYANYPPTGADTITGSAKPTISSAVKGQSSTLTGWTTTISAGDILRFNVDSVSLLTRVTLSLKVKRT
jgi:hypothetical protein